MRKEELEYNMKKYVYQLIDDFFPETNMISKIENRTAKYWVEQNQWRLDEILSAFTDKDESIDTDRLLQIYEDVLFENGEFRVSFKEFAPDSIKPLIPDKVAVFHKTDLYKMVGKENKII